MLSDIANASSRPGDLIADFFIGSGSTIKKVVKLGRRAIGVEIETDHFNQPVAEVSEVLITKDNGT